MPGATALTRDEVLSVLLVDRYGLPTTCHLRLAAY
jgi:hypothetical protein